MSRLTDNHLQRLCRAIALTARASVAIGSHSTVMTILVEDIAAMIVELRERRSAAKLTDDEQAALLDLHRLAYTWLDQEPRERACRLINKLLGDG